MSASIGERRHHHHQEKQISGGAGRYLQEVPDRSLAVESDLIIKGIKNIL